MRLATAALAAVAATACSQASETSTNRDQPVPVEPDNGIGDGAPPLREAIDVIPSRFHGAWGDENGRCEKASDVRMEIGQLDIRFRETHGRVLDVRIDGEDALVDLRMSEEDNILGLRLGEQESWNRSIRLALRQDGERLLATDRGISATEGDPRLKRCPS